MSVEHLRQEDGLLQRPVFFRYGVVCALETLAPDKPAVYQGPFAAYAQDIANMGYSAIELHLRNPAQYDVAALRKAAGDAGLSFSALSTGLEYGLNGLSLVSDDAVVRTAAIRRLKEHVDLAAELGCLVVVGTMRDQVNGQSRRTLCENRLTEALLSLSDYAAPLGVVLAVESITRYINNYLNTVPETAAYIRALNRANITLHIDTHSMNIEDPDLPAAIHRGKDVLGYVHFSDSNRRFPGAGNIDFKPVLQALQAVGYQGFIVSECLPWPDARSCARLGLLYMKALESCLQVEAYRYLSAD